VSLFLICRHPQCVAILNVSLSFMCRYHLCVAIPYVSLSFMCCYPVCVAILSLSRHLSLVCFSRPLSISRVCIFRVSVCLSPWRFLVLCPLSISLSFASTFGIFPIGSPSVLPPCPCLLFRLLSLLSVALSPPCCVTRMRHASVFVTPLDSCIRKIGLTD